VKHFTRTYRYEQAVQLTEERREGLSLAALSLEKEKSKDEEPNQSAAH
jgi:hypothetical protein